MIAKALGCIICISSVFAGVWAIDDRYTHQAAFEEHQKIVMDRYLNDKLERIQGNIRRIKAIRNPTPAEQEYLRYLLKEQASISRKLNKGKT